MYISRGDGDVHFWKQVMSRHKYVLGLLLFLVLSLDS